MLESQKREINVLRDIITATKLSMGIVLYQSNTIHEDINEQWCQPPKAEVDKTVKAEIVKVQLAPAGYAAKLAISKGGLYIHLH